MLFHSPKASVICNLNEEQNFERQGGGAAQRPVEKTRVGDQAAHPWIRRGANSGRLLVSGGRGVQSTEIETL